MGRLTDPAGSGYRLVDVLEAHFDRNDPAQTFIKAINAVDYSSLAIHMRALVNPALTHCRGVIEGRPDALARVDEFYSKRNRKLVERVIAYGEDV